jgi:eukaryotic-like serine/threonine-protein kinase
VVRRIVERALESEVPTDQEAVIRREAGDDLVLAARALRILHAERRSSSLEQTSAGEALSRAMLDQTPPAMVGAVLGKYRLRALLGVGGMGAVYEAHDDLLDRNVALKMIHPALATPALAQRFTRECRSLARVHHPGIARVYEAGQLELGAHQLGDWPLPARLPYLAMELVRDGRSLTTAPAVAALDWSGRIRLLASICDAVHAAHQQGVIHRDLKPDNILIDTTGSAKIIDFGIARMQEDADRTTAGRPSLDSITKAGSGMLGTIRYLSPEQLASPLAGDVRSDVYALGVTMHELLTSKSPYVSLEQSTPVAMARLVADIESHNVRSFTLAPHPTSPPWTRLRDLQAVVAMAMAHDPSHRYQSAADLARDLLRLLTDEPILARASTRFDEVRMFTRRHRTFVAGVALLVLSVTAGVVGTTVGLLRARASQRTAELQARRATQLADFFQSALQSASPQNMDWNRGHPATLMHAAGGGAGGGGQSRILGQPGPG